MKSYYFESLVLQFPLLSVYGLFYDREYLQFHTGYENPLNTKKWAMK